MIRDDREDYSDQETAVTEARRTLSVAASDLARQAKQVASACASRRGEPDLDALYAAVSTVRRAEEAFYLARLDLSTAKGADA